MIKGAGKATGQVHHILSNKIIKALEENPTLKGVFKREDPDFMYRAKEIDVHKGYQQWHRNIDNEVVDWLQSNPNATPKEFKNKLNEIYQRPDIKEIIPDVDIK